MSSRHTRESLGNGSRASSLSGHALARSAVGRALVDELRTVYQALSDPVVGVALGRVVVLMPGVGLAASPPATQLSEARRIAAIARDHLREGPWYVRRLVGRAVVAVYEDHSVDGGSIVLRYVECTVVGTGG